RDELRPRRSRCRPLFPASDLELYHAVPRNPRAHSSRRNIWVRHPDAIKVSLPTTGEEMAGMIAGEYRCRRTVELEVSILSTFETGATTRRIDKNLSVARHSDINPQSGAFPRGANRRLAEQSMAAHGKRLRGDRFL